ncbi:MAG: carboxypeptidase-like regulatory domain-containing protein [Balneolaceae bacterium]|nr:carboxypeptidase-like regulatory domain-containing protein [Balneolaceae bacterium]
MMLWLLLYASAAFSQTITVLDSETNEPLAGVNIFSEDRSIAKATDSNGEASLAEFKGVETIIFSYVGYQIRRFSYNEIVESDLRVEMDKRPIPLGQTVISANRWQQDTREIPVTISQVTPEEVQLQNPQTAADLLGVSRRCVYPEKSDGGR